MEGRPEVRIIKLLNQRGSGDFVSGTALSRALGVSRTAVWKHVGNLKKMGFRITAVPSRGYRLEEERPFNSVSVSSLLSTEVMGKKIFFYDSLDSTNTKAFELARAGEAEGVSVIAESQIGGKGRLGRSWFSPPGVNLYTSVILRPELPPFKAKGLTLMAAVAVSETIASHLGRRPSVKWPNDILIGSKKTAGILMEMDAEEDRVNFVVAGIGVNLNTASFPETLKATATSVLLAVGRPVDRASFARDIYSSLEKWYGVFLGGGGLPRVLEEWRGYFQGEGMTMRVRSFNEVVEGVCEGVDSDGALLLRRGARVERIVAGDVEL